ncbi:mitochondrial potassium channel ATP-binding subunit, partial [Ascaphus truei]|uniref:mitochondrial potassium channel ATP-binding subunit n=1 Tax=Ascaphus truei TaxID=8439 RepID=UPI003F598F26
EFTALIKHLGVRNVQEVLHLQGSYTCRGPTTPEVLHLQGSYTSRGPTPPEALHLQRSYTSRDPTPPGALHLQGPYTSRGPPPPEALHLQRPYTSRGPTPPGVLHLQGSYTSRGPTPPGALHLQGSYTSRGPTPPEVLHLQGPYTSRGPTPPGALHLQGPSTSIGPPPPEALHLQGSYTSRGPTPPGALHLHGSYTSFGYPTRPGHKVLKDFNLRIPPGRTVAIVGQSGGGKSTVAVLLERFYDPSQGEVRLDGVDIRTLDPSWLRREVIGFINQEPVLFGTSIMENIRFGKPDASDSEVYAAAKQANADLFIRSFPEGYNTVLGERGVTLSGGQKQRVAIARALVKDPSILILDEATSALDSESERAVQLALDRATCGRTVLVIAHRLSTIAGADLIVVLSEGRVAEAGTHTELLRAGGLYAELIHRQAKETH